MNEYICIRENYLNGTYWKIGDKVRNDECPNHHFLDLTSESKEIVRQINNDETEPEAVDLAERVNRKKNRQKVKNGN